MKKVAIIGGGSSGLTAIKCCLDEGFEPVCFERYSDIGGIWNYQEKVTEGRASVYKSCIVNTSKEMMAYSDFPMPAHFPPFMAHHKLLEYLRLYAGQFNLLQYIRFNTSVQQITKAENYHTSGCWVVKSVSENTEKEETFDAVVVCTGHHSKPHKPRFPGEETFQGITMHSQQYRTSDCFKNKKVLVIGIGNSAVDIAVDASKAASHVFLSTRRGAWVVSRMGVWGLPNDMLANNRALFCTGKPAMQWMVEKMANLRCNHEVYGLQPLHRGLEAHPTINDELPHQILRGNIQIKNNVTRFTSTGVEFEDGTCADIDIVVFATGYHYQCPFLDPSVMEIKDNKTSLYKYVFPPHLDHPTLAIIGLVQAVGAVMPLAEIQSRWFYRILKGECSLPAKDVMLEDISAKERSIQAEYLNTPRHALETMWVPYMDEIAKQFGAKPDLWKMAKTDFAFSLRCFFGPCVPAQYRLQGPNAWNGAKSTIGQAFENCKNPLTTRKVQKPTSVPARKNIGFFNYNLNKMFPEKSALVYVLKFFLCMLLLSSACF